MHHDFGESSIPILPPHTEPEPVPHNEPYDLPGAPLPDMQVALLKSTHTCTRYPIHDYLAYSHLSTESYACTIAIDTHIVPRNVTKALNHPGWFKAMQKEMDAL